jgi:acetyl-CoA acetyltransferase
MRSALAVAGLQLGQVDGLGVASFTLKPDTAIDLAWRAGIRPTWILDDLNGGAAALDMLQHAVRAIEAGDAQTIVLVAGGHSAPDDFADLASNFNKATRDHLAPIPYGGPNALYSLLTRRHMGATGLERSDYGQVCIAQRRWAERNPGAVYRSPLTMDDYLSAPLVADPLGMFDCVPRVTGADAVVLSRERPPLAQSVVRIKAIKALYNHDQQELDGLETGLRVVANELWTEAGVEPSDVDVASIYDDYPAMVLIQLSDLGFIRNGDIKRFVEKQLAIDGWPLNTSGGQLSAGQASSAGGMHGLVEAVIQLQGKAGARQIEECKIAVVTGYGMTLYRYGACANAAVLERA